jgi:predicted alpha-1,6-mannanase (GH76 family)
MNLHTQFANGGVETIQSWFNSSTCLWDTTGWWNSANVLWMLLDYSARTKNDQYHQVAAQVFEKNKGGNFLNNFYDDEGWWALTWIKAYDVIGDDRYFEMARTIFSDMTKGWDDHCGGGMWWSKDRKYKNAIANELFFSIAASLSRHLTLSDEHGTLVDRGQRIFQQATDVLEHHETDQASYLDWAKREWNWFAKSGMINSAHLINDGLNDSCQNNGGTTWTYNQGVVLSGLVDMSALTKDGSYIQTAQAIADATINTLVDGQGILHEPCEPNCGPDAPQFKGIFVRNLGILADATHNDRYHQFIQKNADAIVQNNQTPPYHFGLTWSSPDTTFDAARQCSALDTLNVAMSLTPA